MSFVIGFVTGASTAGAVERRKRRSQFREYMERRGYSVVDRTGRPVPLEAVIDEGLKGEPHNGSAVLVAGVVLIGAAVLTGGSALLVLTVI